MADLIQDVTRRRGAAHGARGPCEAAARGAAAHRGLPVALVPGQLVGLLQAVQEQARGRQGQLKPLKDHTQSLRSF